MRKFSPFTKSGITRTALLALVAAGCLAAPRTGLSGDLILKKGDRVAIVGDSITEQKMYSKYMELYLLACVPELDLTMYQFGWSGQTAPGFAGRMEGDMVPWKPTLVTTCFGMNDGRYVPYTDAIGKDYEAGTSRIQARCRKLGARMIVGGPGPVDSETYKRNEPDADQPYNDNLAKLSEIAGHLAKSNNFVYAELHPAMMKVMQEAKTALGKEYHVCGGDGVHPGANGQLVMAYTFLKAMGLDGAIGTVTVDMTGNATATKGHRVLSSADGKVEIESTRYPFCFYGNEKDPNGTRSILPFLPFNADLNRYLLVVKNLSEPMADVTWGKTTKTFANADLKTGINLADAFPDNPFSKPFLAIESVVASKQQGETGTIKGRFPKFIRMQAEFPADDKEVTDALDTLRRKYLERNAKDAVRAREAVKPVTHTIQITPKKAEQPAAAESR